MAETHKVKTETKNSCTRYNGEKAITSGTDSKDRSCQKPEKQDGPL